MADATIRRGQGWGYTLTPTWLSAGDPSSSPSGQPHRASWVSRASQCACPRARGRRGPAGPTVPLGAQPPTPSPPLIFSIRSEPLSQGAGGQAPPWEGPPKVFGDLFTLSHSALWSPWTRTIYSPPPSTPKGSTHHRSARSPHLVVQVRVRALAIVHSLSSAPVCGSFCLRTCKPEPGGLP